MESFFSWLAVYFDLPILDGIAENLHCPFLDKVMVPISALGDGGILWIAIALLLLIFPKTRKTGIAMGFALLMGLIVCNGILKPLIHRPRPYDYQLLHYGKQIRLLIPPLSDGSFPSGHTIASFEAATALVLFRKRLGIPALVMASFIAFSRLYLYVHYPTDVLFSVVLGIGFGYLGSYLAKRIYKAKE